MSLLHQTVGKEETSTVAFYPGIPF